MTSLIKKIEFIKSQLKSFFKSNYEKNQKLVYEVDNWNKAYRDEIERVSWKDGASINWKVFKKINLKPNYGFWLKKCRYMP